MVDRSQIREHMDVVGPDGARVGRVDGVEGDRIKLTRVDSPDGQHHYLPLSEVTRVDDRVHVATGAIGNDLGVGTDTTRSVAGAAPMVENRADLPPIRNRQVEGSRPRSNFYLPWIVGAVGLLLLVLLLHQCNKEVGKVPEETPAAVAAAAPVTPAAPAAALPVETVTLPGGRTFSAAPQSLNYELQRFLASSEPAPRSFTFDQLNFATNAATIRDEDRATVDALGDILAAYPAARVRITGYADARGAEPANATLGAERAAAVRTALVAKGVAENRIETASGGENDPVATNADPAGRLENRRSELTVLAK
jgi:outer membrane protein OmpA-like peptidoglycan-associated protein